MKLDWGKILQVILRTLVVIVGLVILVGFISLLIFIMPILAEGVVETSQVLENYIESPLRNSSFFNQTCIELGSVYYGGDRLCYKNDGDVLIPYKIVQADDRYYLIEKRGIF